MLPSYGQHVVNVFNLPRRAPRKMGCRAWPKQKQRNFITWYSRPAGTARQGKEVGVRTNDGHGRGAEERTASSRKQRDVVSKLHPRIRKAKMQLQSSCTSSAAASGSKDPRRPQGSTARSPVKFSFSCNSPCSSKPAHRPARHRTR